MRTKTPFLGEKMLDAAGKLFGSKRFHEVRMEDIAGEAGVSKGTLYRYFHDKEEMFLALLEQASARLLAELKRRVEQAQTNKQRLIGVVDAVVTFFDDNPHVFDLILRAEIGQDEGKRFPWQEVRAEGTRIVANIFEDGKATGEFRITHPETSMLMFLGGMRAVIRGGSKPRPERLAEQIVDDFLYGSATIVKRASKTA